ncbi:MAG: SUF system Fe-S cluster assembly regulator [Solimonas sp.]
MLRISKLTDYATVILANLATRTDRICTASELATITHLSTATVSKLLKKLQRGGLVTSSRGAQGGYQLARPATHISAADILDALEGRFALTECSGEHSNCGIASSCRVGTAWRRVNAAIVRALKDVSLSQLAGLERHHTVDINLSRHTAPLTRMSRTHHE